MNRFAKTFTLSACALAASLLISACGGGTSGDTVAPTVAITSVANRAGVVTFTFKFSESVGTSFSIEDLVVTNGTPGGLTKVDATTYTVDVTPTGTAAPSVTLAAGKVFDLANNPNAVAASNTYAPPPTAPTTAAATPTALAANVSSIYSDAYTPVAGVDLRPDWGQSTQVSEVLVASNKTEKYTAFNYEGIQFANTDVSAMSKLHIDVWTPDVTSFKVSIISPGKENAVTLTPTLGGWNNYDIDLSQYTVPDKTAIFQIKLEGTPTGGTLFFDNLYFWKAPAAVSCGTTVPTCAPTTSIPAGATTIYSDAASVAGFNPFPNWGQTTTETEVTIASNKSLKYVFPGVGFPGGFEGLDWAANPVDVSTKGKLHLDLWSPDLTSVKVSIISTGKENAYTQAITAGNWNSVDIDLSNYTVPDLKAIIQIKLETVSSGGTLYVDNIYFWGTASGTGGTTTTTPVDMGSGGAQTMTMYPATGAPACGAPAQPLCLFTTGDYIFAGDYKGGLEAGTGRYATFVGSQTVAPAVLPTALAGGDIGHYNDPAIDSSSQKLAAEGWVTGTSTDPAGSPNFFYQFVLTKPAATFASSYMGVYVNAPQNGTVDVSARSNMKLRIWGPGQMYQNNIPTSSNVSLNPVLNLTLAGPKNVGCSSGSGGSEITKNLIANSTIGGAAEYTVSLAGWTLVTGCGGDASAADVLKHVARIVVNIPAASFNFTNPNGTAGVDATAYLTGVNLGAISFK